MANYNDKVQGIIEGLSDFWLLYFKETDQLKVLYQGADILIGQSYLDLLSLLLNNSLQDAPLFNKELFKLLQIKETDIRYLQRSNTDSSKYVYILPDNVVDARALNNKIFSVTNALERDIDYDVNITDRTFEFSYDPLNAYIQADFGTGNSAFTLRTKDPSIRTLYVQLVDSGILPISITRNSTGDTITISYDGPANTGTTRARDIVGTINAHPVFGGLLFAELALSDGGRASPIGTGLVPLTRLAVNPLDDFATRIVEQVFGGKLTGNGILDWLSLGIEKGDIIRLITGPTIATPQELEVSLVRRDALYTYPGNAIDFIKASDKIAFSILREPEDNTSTGEPFAQTGVTIDTGVDGVIDAMNRRFTSLSATFSPFHKGDLLEITGALNVGYYRILEVEDAQNVILAATTLTDESLLPWNLISNQSPATFLADGEVIQNPDGTTSFMTVTAPFLNTLDVVGSVIRINRAGVLENYEITDRLANDHVLINAPNAVEDTGLSCSWVRYFTPALTTAYPFVKKGSVSITARRAVDEQAVVENRDFIVDDDAATILPITVWRTDVDLTVTYDYRLAIVPRTVVLQSGGDGTLTYGATSTFSSPTANFSYYDIGNAIDITNSVDSPTNNGTYFISAITSATTVQLTNDRLVSSVADTNNGSLGWSVRRLGVFQTENIIAPVRETSFWAPDALVDRFHLYNTFGYLINRFAQSSEEYRSLIRGIFQLFMLGPTLERFESAVNTVAGLSVIRDNGEILLNYSAGELQSGNDGVFDATTNTFTSATGNFASSTSIRYIYAASGLNNNKLFRIVQYISSTSVLLDSTPVSESGVSWEFTDTALQIIRTSKRTYTFARNIPIRSTVKDPSNFGVKIFRAFEVLTDAFTVTDYVESPTWWERVQIPEQLWAGEDAIRRQSTPALFENTIGASDGPRIGDPGFFIGADSQGFTPPSVFQYDDGGLSDGVLVGDVNYPNTNNVYFNTTTNALFTAGDLGNILVVGGVNRYRILQVVSTSNIKIESFVPVTNTSGLAWSVESQPRVLRHKAAFVVLDTWLKYHLFSLTFDPALLGALGSELITDLQSLVLIAKPSYTYIVLSPSSLFQEIIQITEDEIVVDPEVNLGGSAGEIISGEEDPILVIGSSWRIGAWFRYIESTGSFSAPAANITDVLGTPDPGYVHHLTKFVIDVPTDFTTNGRPIPHSGHVRKLVTSGVNAEISFVDNEWVITVPSATFTDYSVGAVLTLSGGVVNAGANNGDHYIGRVIDSTNAVIGDYTTPGAETGLTWSLYTHGSVAGFIRNTNRGETLFTDGTGSHLFDLAHVGDYVRFVFTSYATNMVFRIGYVAANNSAECKLFDVFRVFPIVGDPDFTGAVSGTTFTATAALFSFEMTRVTRAYTDAATELTKQYYVVFTSGANSGQRRRIENYISDFSVTLEGAALTTDAAVDYYVEMEQSPVVTTETSTWEHLKNFLVINENTLDLSNTPTQDASTPVLYTAYGVREPIDPATETFDETLGDTYYSIGMPNPRPKQGRRRSGQDTDLREDPIQITRT